MKFKEGLLYMLSVMGIYLGMSFVEIFLLEPLVDFIGTGFWVHLVVYGICLLLVNPICTWFIAKLLPFKAPQIKVVTPLDE